MSSNMSLYSYMECYRKWVRKNGDDPYIKIGTPYTTLCSGVYWWIHVSSIVTTRVEKFHGSLLSDLAQPWQCPDRLVWKFWSGSDLALVSIP